MRPNIDSVSGHKPDFLPPDAKLEAGYIRYIRSLPGIGPGGEICFETCIRRFRTDEEEEDEIPPPDWFSYTAISYSWGDPTLSHPISVDGHERVVATNLWHFLQRANTQAAESEYAKAQRVSQLCRRRADWLDSQFESPMAQSRLKDTMEASLAYAKSLCVNGEWRDWISGKPKSIA